MTEHEMNHLEPTATDVHSPENNPVENEKREFFTSSEEEPAELETAFSQLKSNSKNKRQKSTAPKKAYENPIVSIGGTLQFETPEAIRLRQKQQFLQQRKTKEILTGKITSTEMKKYDGMPNLYCAVIEDEQYKILIPHIMFSFSEETIREETKGDSEKYQREMMRLMDSYLGAEVDFIIHSVSDTDPIVVGSRTEALSSKMNYYYFPNERTNKKAIISENTVVETRIVNTKRTGLVLEAFGCEVFVPNDQLSYQWIADASRVYKLGDYLPFKVENLQYDVKNRRVQLKGSVKAATEDARRRAYNNLSLEARVIGTVTGTTDNGIFVNLGSIDCLCPFPRYGGVPLIGEEVTVKIKRKIDDNKRLFINGIIVHRQDNV